MAALCCVAGQQPQEDRVRLAGRGLPVEPGRSGLAVAVIGDKDAALPAQRDLGVRRGVVRFDGLQDAQIGVWCLAVAGLVVWGLGLAPVFPLLYTTAARLPGTSAGAGLGWMLLGQRFGGMLTSVGVGSVSQWQGMRIAFGAVAGAALALMLVSLREGNSAARRSSDA